MMIHCLSRANGTKKNIFGFQNDHPYNLFSMINLLALAEYARELVCAVFANSCWHVQFQRALLLVTS